jgi:hypothetical protein
VNFYFICKLNLKRISFEIEFWEICKFTRLHVNLRRFSCKSPSFIYLNTSVDWFTCKTCFKYINCINVLYFWCMTEHLLIFNHFPSNEDFVLVSNLNYWHFVYFLIFWIHVWNSVYVLILASLEFKSILDKKKTQFMLP